MYSIIAKQYNNACVVIPEGKEKGWFILHSGFIVIPHDYFINDEIEFKEKLNNVLKEFDIPCIK